MRYPLFKFANPIRFDKHTKIGELRGADLYVHWTVFVVAAIILSGALRSPVLSLLGLAAYLSVLLIHEAGHLVAAQRLGCEVFSIELYPIFGVTKFGTPWSRFDHCVIAWGGVLAQAAVAVPIVLWVEAFGYPRLQVLNMLVVILGFFSIGEALFNLLPVAPLDGMYKSRQCVKISNIKRANIDGPGHACSSCGFIQSHAPRQIPHRCHHAKARFRQFDGSKQSKATGRTRNQRDLFRHGKGVPQPGKKSSRGKRKSGRIEVETPLWRAHHVPKGGAMLINRHRLPRNPYFHFHPLHTGFSLLTALILFGMLAWVLAVPAK